MVIHLLVIVLIVRFHVKYVKYLSASSRFEGLSSRRSLAIPRIIHYTFKTAGVLSKRERDIMLTCERLNPDWQVMYHTDEIADALIQQEFPQFLEVYRQLPKNVERADFFRYAVLYHYGGLYLDTDVECVVPLEDWLGEHVQLVVGVETEFSSVEEATLRSYARRRQYQQWTILSTERHPVMRLVLQKIAEIFRRGLLERFDISDRGTLDRTGPGVWTDTVTEYLNAELTRMLGAFENDEQDVDDMPHFAERFWVLPRISSAGFPNGGDYMDTRSNKVVFLHHFLGGWKVSRKKKMQLERGKDITHHLPCFDAEISRLNEGFHSKSVFGGRPDKKCEIFTLDNLEDSAASTYSKSRLALDTNMSEFGYPITIVSRSRSALVFVESIHRVHAHYGAEEDATLTSWGVWQGNNNPAFAPDLLDIFKLIIKQILEESNKSLIFFEYGSKTGWLSLSMAMLDIPTLAIPQTAAAGAKLTFSTKISGLSRLLTVLESHADKDTEHIMDFSSRRDANAGFAFHVLNSRGLKVLYWCARRSVGCSRKLKIATVFANSDLDEVLLSDVLSAYLQSETNFAVYYSGSICRYLFARNSADESTFPKMMRKVLRTIRKTFMRRQNTGVALALRKQNMFKNNWCLLSSSGAAALARIMHEMSSSETHVILIVREELRDVLQFR